MASTTAAYSIPRAWISSGVVKQFLIVDDNPADARLLCEALAEFGVEDRVFLASNASEALATLEAGRFWPYLVLVGININNDSGFSVLERLRKTERFHDVPIIAVVDSQDPAVIHRAYENQANACISKPTTYSEWVLLAESIVNFWSRVLSPRSPKL
ncbi:MAG: response regulator [Candidatus Poribacteria bacterium]|nr:MAG: response regulator [Candidatus Poribacteria bacterium]